MGPGAQVPIQPVVLRQTDTMTVVAVGLDALWPPGWTPPSPLRHGMRKAVGLLQRVLGCPKAWWLKGARWLGAI